MSLLSADAGIRAQLHTDIASAWAPTKIYDNPPVLPNTAANLPLAFVELQEVKPERSGPGAGAQEVSAKFVYLLTRIAPVPASGVIEAEKIAKTSALTDLLQANPRYATWKRDITAVTFDETQIEESEELIYSVQIEFTLTVIADA